MLQQTVQIDQPAKVGSQQNFVFQQYQKTTLLVLVAGLLYLRLVLRKRKKDKICPHCDYRNPYHRSNCTKCSAPLFGVKQQ